MKLIQKTSNEKMLKLADNVNGFAVIVEGDISQLREVLTCVDEETLRRLKSCVEYELKMRKIFGL